jgi:hypothetical protein
MSTWCDNFFYGTVADLEVLTRHLSVIEEPVLHPATVIGGVLETWGGKYLALVNGPKNAKFRKFAVPAT